MPFRCFYSFFLSWIPVLVCASASCARDANSPEFSRAAVKLIDANGKPVANSEDVECFALETGSEAINSRWTSGTDGQGRIEFSLNAGAWRVVFRVPKTGYVSTGTILPRKGETMEIEVPRLAPFGSIQGRFIGAAPFPFAGSRIGTGRSRR